MRLTVLGSGTSVPHAERASSGYWLQTGGHSVLLDCSAASITRMAAAGLDWAGLDAIWISHFHLDHVGGLAPLLNGLKHAEATQEREKPLCIYGPAGILDLLNAFDGAYDYGIFKQPFPLEIGEVEPDTPFEIVPGLRAVTWPTPHTDESCAIHLSRDGRSLVYTADTGFSEVIAAFAQGCSTLLMECSFIAKKPVEKHLELAEAMFIVRKAKPEKAVFTHFYPEWDGKDLGEMVKRFSPPCDVIAAKDGMQIDI